MSIIRRSFALSAASKYTQFLLMLGSNMALARLLTPAEIGIYAVAAVLAGMAQTFRDMGIGQYLIREPEIDHAKLQVTFTLMTMVAWTLGAGLFLVSGSIANLYGEPILQTVLRIQAIAFFIIPFGAISLTLLKREFRFGANYYIQVSSSAVQAGVAIALAAFGLGALSLAWASVAGVLITVVGAVVARRGQFVFWPSFRGAKSVLTFGGYVTVTQLLANSSRDIPELMIGKLMGVSSLAFFSKAMLPAAMFGRFVMGALNPVLLPAFSKKYREKDYKQPLLHGVACLTALVVPGLVLAAFLSEWVVMLLFGPQWEQAVDPMRIFAISTAVGSMTSIFRPLLVALGYPQAPMKIQLITVPVRIALIFFAIPYGLVAISFAWLTATMLAVGIQFYVIRRLARIWFRDLFKAIAPSVVFGSLIATGVSAFVWWVAPEITVFNSAFVLAGSGLVLALLWLATLAALKHPLYEELRALLRRPRRKRAAEPAHDA